jgi:tRNA G18 (ribose-2'-O)-methylase SpoU
MIDQRLQWYRGVRDPELLARGGRFIAEGRTVVTRLLADPRWHVESVLVSPAARAALGPVLASRPDVAVFVLEVSRLVDLAGYNIHRGCLAVAFRGRARDLAEVVAAAPHPLTLLGLEGLADADNVGACFRHAAAFGVDAVVLDAACADPLYRKAIRTSMAASLRVPFVRGSAWNGMLAWLRSQDVKSVGLTPRGSEGELARSPGALRDAARVVVMVGNEGRGLTPQTQEACDLRLRIEMDGAIDSVNAATAAAIALHARWTWRRLS